MRRPEPAARPETRNVVWALDTYPRIRSLVDVHSAVPVILHSWGSDQNQTTQPAQTFLAIAFDAVRGRPDDTAYGEFISQTDLDAITALSVRMNDAVKAVRGDDYGVEQAYGLYPTSGASDDYAFSRHFADPTQGQGLRLHHRVRTHLPTDLGRGGERHPRGQLGPGRPESRRVDNRPGHVARGQPDRSAVGTSPGSAGSRR